MRGITSVLVAVTTFASCVTSERVPELSRNTFKDAGRSSSHLNIVLAGLVHDANRMSPNVFDFVVEMSCEHAVKVQILATGDIELFQAEYNGARKNGYHGKDCAHWTFCTHP